MGAFSSTQSSNLNQTKMKSLLVCLSVVAVAFADEEAAAPAVLPAFGYPYAAYPYAHAYHAAPAITLPSPVQYQYVPKEVEIEVKTFQPELVETGCKNSFGTPVPCFQAGEARKRRDAEEAAAVVPAATLPLAYAGFPGHLGYPYAHHVAYPHVTYAKPVVQEIEVPTPVYKQVVEKVPLQPLCQNHLGLAVRCL